LLLVLFAGLLLNVHVFAQRVYDAGASDSSVFINPGGEGQSEQRLTPPNSPPINLYFYNNVQNPRPPVQPAEPPPREPEPVIEYRYILPPAPEPVYIPLPPVEYMYIPPPAPEPVYIPLPPVEYMYIPPLAPEPVYIPLPPVEYRYIPPPPAEPVYVPAPTQIRVIPGLPNPDSPKIYRLQVGSYTVHNAADIVAQRIMAAGLQAGIEYYNSSKRVFVPGVRAEDAQTIVQKLELLGFTEVWIRD